MEFFDSQVMQRIAHQVELAAAGAAGADGEPCVGFGGDLGLAEVFQGQAHRGTTLCNTAGRAMFMRLRMWLSDFPVSPGDRVVERAVHRDSAVGQGLQSRCRLQGDNLLPLVDSRPADLEGRRNGCLTPVMTNGIDFAHAGDVNRCLRADATTVYGVIVNLSKQMSTQHDRIQQMLAATGKGWSDVVAATGIKSRAGKKKWADGSFKSITVGHLYRMADLFGCDARWLGTGEGVPFPERDPGTIELLAAWKCVNQEGRVNMVEHARYVVGQPRFRLPADAPNGTAACKK